MLWKSLNNLKNLNSLKFIIYLSLSLTHTHTHIYILSPISLILLNSSLFHITIFSLYFPYIPILSKIPFFPKISLFSWFSLFSLFPNFPNWNTWEYTNQNRTVQNSKKPLRVQTKLSVCKFVCKSVKFALIEMLTHLKISIFTFWYIKPTYNLSNPITQPGRTNSPKLF